MINKKYRVVGGEGKWKLFFIYTPTWYDDDYNGDSSEKETLLYEGALPDCESYMRLHKEGVI